MSGRRVRLLFWPPKKHKFEGKLLQQIVKISRTQVLKVNPKYIQAKNNFMTIELSIQESTVIDILGLVPEVEKEVEFKMINFKCIGQKIGKLICIEGFIKIRIATMISGNSSYGSGA